MKKILILLITMAFLTTGCGSFGKKLKSWVGGGSSDDAGAVAQKRRGPKKPRKLSYDSQKQYKYNTGNRKYKSMTREEFEKSSKVGPKAGSLWKMEGQESYLFSDNKIRLRGDILNIKLEGNPKKQLVTKVKVINNLLARLKKAKAAKRLAAAKRRANAVGKKLRVRKPAAVAKSSDKKEKTDKELFDVEIIPSRIVERLANGDYRVRGGQVFMIDRREYKVIAVGIVKATDIDQDEISADKLLDAKFDIVSPRREVTL